MWRCGATPGPGWRISPRRWPARRRARGRRGPIMSPRSLRGWRHGATRRRRAFIRRSGRSTWLGCAASSTRHCRWTASSSPTAGLPATGLGCSTIRNRRGGTSSRIAAWPRSAMGCQVGSGRLLAAPSTPAVAITGDGGFNMMLGELETARRAGIGLTIVVVNNAASGYVKALQHAMFRGRYQSSDLVEMDYAAIARAMGCNGIRVEDPDRLAAALRDGPRRARPPYRARRRRHPRSRANAPRRRQPYRRDQERRPGGIISEISRGAPGISASLRQLPRARSAGCGRAPRVGSSAVGRGRSCRRSADRRCRRECAGGAREPAPRA